MDKIEKYGGILVQEGNHFDVIAAITQNDVCPFVDEYFEPIYDALNQGVIIETDQKEAFVKLMEYINRFAETGKWSNKEQLKPVEGTDFFEFKVKQIHRVFFYYDKQNRSVIILTHHTVKKGPKIKPADLKRMKDIKKEFEQRRMR